MTILALDTSGPVAGVALLSGGAIRYEAMTKNGKTHSESLMPMLEEALLRGGAARGDITHIAAVTGPGSFTGVRIGVTAAKAMAHALGIPCVAVDALEATAYPLQCCNQIICPIQDARVGQVYGAAFRRGDRLLEDCALKLTEYIARLLPLGDAFLFTGDGAAVYRDAILETLGEKAAFAPAVNAYLRPAAVACIAQRDAGKAVDHLALQPLYLRPPQAERERKARLEREAAAKNEAKGQP